MPRAGRAAPHPSPPRTITLHTIRPRTIALLMLALVLAACTVGPSTRPPLATSAGPGSVAVPQTSASTMPTGPGGPGRTADPIAWTDCPQDVPTTDTTSGRRFALQCGEVSVPKSYTSSDSGDLSLSVARARLSSTPATAPPLVVMVGDAGQNGVHQIASVAGSLPTEILSHFSVVVVDIRGTGDSVPIDCVSDQSSGYLLSLGADPTTPVAAERLAGLSRQLTFDCGDMVGPDLSDYSTVPASDDLDTVRAALGVQTIAFLGQGFGATLGAVYADRYPGRISAAVLDGPADPASASDKQAAAAATAYQATLTSFGQACQTFRGGCPLGADPTAAVTALVAKLGDAGVPSTDGQVISGGSVVLALTDQLGDPTSWPKLAAALASAQQGDTDAVAGLLQDALGTTDVEQQQAGRIVYQCNDSAQRLSGAALSAAVGSVRAAAPLFGPYLLGRVGVCASWPAPESALGPVTAAGAPPILVLGAVDDPVSPYAQVRSLSVELASATLLTWQSGTHGAFPTSSCVTTAVDAYLLNRTVPAAGTLCPP